VFEGEIGGSYLDRKVELFKSLLTYKNQYKSEKLLTFQKKFLKVDTLVSKLVSR
jgi:hypothetical protein